MVGKLKPDGTSTADGTKPATANVGADEAAGNVTTKNSPKLISSTTTTNKRPSILKQQQRSRGAGRPSLQRSNSTSFNQSMRNLRNNFSRQSSQSFR